MGLTTGNLLTNRPMGLMTGQANLFAGFLAMQALLLLFVSRTADLGRAERLFLTGTAVLMMATLLFTLSRGAWLAFAVTAAVVGFSTNRGLVVLLVVVFLVGYRWAPREAVTRADLTVRAVEQSTTATAHWKSLWTIPRHCASSNGNRFPRCSWRVLSGVPAWERIRSGSVGRPGFFGPLTPPWSRLAQRWAHWVSSVISACWGR